MPNLIALDFDGVLNNHRYWGRQRKIKSQIASLTTPQGSASDPNENGQLLNRAASTDREDRRYARVQKKLAESLELLDPENVRELEKLVILADAYIVVSSTWRLHYMSIIPEALRITGAPVAADRILGNTIEYLKDRWWQGERSRVIRGLEIEHWMLTKLAPEVLLETRLVIIDDDSDFGRLREACHVQTTLFAKDQSGKARFEGNGLQASHVARAIRIFEEQTPKAGEIILRTPNPAWTIEGRESLGYSTR